jgi:hypothetical protein
MGAEPDGDRFIAEVGSKEDARSILLKRRREPSAPLLPGPLARHESPVVVPGLGETNPHCTNVDSTSSFARVSAGSRHNSS